MRISKRLTIASDMMQLINTINKIEPSAHSAYQYQFYAKKIILKLANGKTIKSILNGIKEDTENKNNAYHLSYIADENAREFFKMYLDSLNSKKPLKLAYYQHNNFEGDNNIKELQEKYKKLKNEFFR